MGGRGTRWGLVGALGLSLVSACAFGQKHRYDDVVARLSYSGQGQLAVVTQDRRPYVLSGEKETHFVGFSRGGYGNKFDVITMSGQPLANDMTTALASTLRTHGFQAVPVLVGGEMPPGEVARRVRATGAPRAVVFTLAEWNSDTYSGTALIYDVSLRVLDASGGVLAETTLSGRDNLGADFWNPGAHARKAIPPAFRRKLQQLLDDPRISAALRSAASGP